MSRLRAAVLAGLTLLPAVVVGQAPRPADQLKAMREALAPTGTIRASFLGTNPIQGRVDRQTGQVTGVVADVVQHLGMELGVPTKLVADENAAAVIRSVTTGAVDFGFLAYDIEREAQIDYA